MLTMGKYIVVKALFFWYVKAFSILLNYLLILYNGIHT